MKVRYNTSIGKIRSLEDLQSEKHRVQRELKKTEEEISANYHQILHAFSLRNLLTTVSNDVALASTAIQKTFSFGKTLFGKVRKKKKKGGGHDAGPEETGS